MNLCFVTPRYGDDVVGGAERQAREYAERMAAAGNQVTVLTTCAKDHVSWANALPPGESVHNGVTVRRFPITQDRDMTARARVEGALSSGLRIPRSAQDEWVRSSGDSEPLLEAIAATSKTGAVLVFTPYLFATTVRGAAVSPERSIVIPCLHDEPYARFELIQETMRDVAGLIFNTDAEARLARDLLGELPPHRTVGFGFDPAPPTDAAVYRASRRLEGDLVTYVGRRERGKNFPLLLSYITAYDRLLSAQPPVMLLTLGSGSYEVPSVARHLMRDLGFVSTDEKFQAMSASVVLANLSLNESFSHVLAEAWLVETPVIVHAECPVTVEHCANSGGGLWVDSPEMFAATLDRLRVDSALRRRLGRCGRDYVTKQYSWPAVLARFTAAVDELAA